MPEQATKLLAENNQYLEERGLPSSLLDYELMYVVDMKNDEYASYKPYPTEDYLNQYEE